MTMRTFLLGCLFTGALGAFIVALARNSPVTHPVATPNEWGAAASLGSLGGATQWLNAPPLNLEELRGRVILVDFWTHTCINWRRTLPYVRSWAEKYQDRGLVVIGVHSPEFDFEKDVDGVRVAAESMQIHYPVAVDSDHAIWRSFGNQFWPALYLIDAQGRVRYHVFGEGNYERSERVIQELLAEAGAGEVRRDLVQIDAVGAEAAPDWANLKSPETYLGYERGQNLASATRALPDARQLYSIPARLPLNHWALSGEWTVARQQILMNGANGSLSYRFHARDLHLVMGPSKSGQPVRFRVLVDGAPAGAVHGADVDEEGNGTASEVRLYQLIRQTAPIADRQFEIEFLDPGIQVFAFTFG